MIVGILGMGGLVLDMGHVYYSYNELQASTNAAALAGAQTLPNLNAATVATQYSSVAGNLNAHANLPNVQMVSGYPMMKCVTALTNESIPCVAPANANAIIVKQQVAVRTYFGGLFGIPNITLTATAAAAMRGGATPPYNVAIIVDTSGSMSSTDSSCGRRQTRINCALAGVQTLLGELSPCGSSEQSCGIATNGQVPNFVDQVSLFAFPNVSQSTAKYDYNCGSSSPSSQPYTFPTAGASSYSPASGVATYQIVNYSSDYRLSDTATSLNTASNLTIAAGGNSNCNGMRAVGGQGTYYAGVIYAAQASLVAIQPSNPNSQNVIIILGDGDVSTTKSSEMPGASTTSGTYPSTRQECHQAVTAAQAAAAAGTRVYSVAYGAASSGCSTDTNPSISPCQTMQEMASSPSTFFSDYAAGSSSCQSAARPTTNLNQIFTEIAGDFTTARLVPMNLITESQ